MTCPTAKKKIVVRTRADVCIIYSVWVNIDIKHILVKHVVKREVKNIFFRNSMSI